MAREPNEQLPLDPDAKMPPAVAAAAKAAEDLHRQVYGGSPPETPASSASSASPTTQMNLPLEPVQTRPGIDPGQAPRQAGEDYNGSWENKYHAMLGRYEQAQQQVGSLQGTVEELGDELMRTQQMLRQPPEARNGQGNGQPQPGQAPRRYITEEDVDTYGEDLLKVMQRVALDTVAPEIIQTRQQLGQVTQHLGQSAQDAMIAVLNQQVPDWKQIDRHQRFKQWCSYPDIYSGQIRANLLVQAFQAADTPRVLAFFRGFLAEEQATGQLPAPAPAQNAPPSAPPRAAAMSLDMLAAPGRPKPAGGELPLFAADKPAITRPMIQDFFRRVNRGEYRDRPQEKANFEAAIQAAVREGRVPP